MLDDYSELEFQHQKEFVKEEILFHISPSEVPQHDQAVSPDARNGRHSTYDAERAS